MPLSNPQTLIIQFTKSPDPEPVKTRLASVLSRDQRRELHCALTEWVCGQLQSPFCQHELWVAGNLAHPFIQSIPKRYRLVLCQQRGQDLGERMAEAVKQGLQSYGQVIIIGSDCPFIDLDYLEKAIQQLHQHDVVVGPATDGGYVLLGMKRFNPLLFSDIPWGSAMVLAATLTAINHSAETVHLLRPLTDIDRPDDLSALADANLPDTLRQFAKYNA